MKNGLKKYRFFLFGGLSIVVIGVICGVKEYNRRLADTHQLNAAFHFKADDFLRQFEAEESMATKQYAGKVISVQGLVGSVQITDTSGTVFLNDGTSMSSVMCQFDKKNFQEILELQNGESITIKGICSGYLMDVVMVRCVLE